MNYMKIGLIGLGRMGSGIAKKLISEGHDVSVWNRTLKTPQELGIKNYELRKDKKKFAGLSSEERKIVELLENEPLQFDEIVRRLSLDPAKVGTILSMMEIKGLIKNSGGNYSIVTG